MTTAIKKYPDFFKVFLPQRSSQRLLIPDVLLKLNCSLDEDVLLRNRNGRVWPIKARMIGGRQYFEDGWKRFQEENSLEAADFLVFTSDGGNIFNVKILDLSGCEKIEVMEGDHDHPIELEEEEEEEEEDNCDDDDEYTDKNPCFVARQIKGRPNELHIPHKIIKDFSLPERITLTSCKCQDLQINEERDYHLSLPEQKPIHKNIKQERGEVCTWKDGRVCILGWASFCKKNRIKENDVSICEIVFGEGQRVQLLRVHVRCSWMGRIHC